MRSGKPVAIGLLWMAWLAGDVAAHSGGLDRHGCHTNRKTGEYHCHRGANTDAAQARPLREPQQLAPGSLSPAPDRPFRNCDEARAQGAAPVRRGDPGYGPHLDRDQDGVGCEPRPRR